LGKGREEEGEGRKRGKGRKRGRERGCEEGRERKRRGGNCGLHIFKDFARFLVLVFLHQTLPMISLGPKEDSLKQLYNFNILTTAFKLRIQKKILHT
jgi:hypothetical protein